MDKLHCRHFEYCNIAPFVKGIPDGAVINFGTL
jgi:hypothetical protein